MKKVALKLNIQKTKIIASEETEAQRDSEFLKVPQVRARTSPLKFQGEFLEAFLGQHEENKMEGTGKKQGN